MGILYLQNKKQVALSKMFENCFRFKFVLQSQTSAACHLYCINCLENEPGSAMWSDSQHLHRVFPYTLVLGGRRMVRSGQPDLTDYGVRMAVGQLGDHVDFMKYCERNETGAAVTAASLLALSLCCSESRWRQRLWNWRKYYIFLCL